MRSMRLIRRTTSAGVPRCSVFLLLLLSQSYTGAASVLVDEFDPSPL